MRLLRTEWIVMLLSVAVLALIVGLLILVNPVPPQDFTWSTGPESDPTLLLAREYAEIVAADGFSIEIVTGEGAAQSLERIVAGEADVTIAQTGIATPEQAEVLQSLGSLYFQPIWIFHRADLEVNFLRDLRGRSIYVGTEGSGTRLLAERLLAANGVTADNSTLVVGGFTESREQLFSGEVDAAFYVTSPDAALVSELLSNENFTLFDVRRSDAYRATYPFLTVITIGEGMIDLIENVPAEPKTVLAVAANLIVRQDIHPNIVRLLMRTATDLHGSAGTFEDAGQFPSRSFVDLPMHPEALRYLNEGESFWEQNFPFLIAGFLDRFIVLLIPLIPLLYPVIRGVPPLYQFTIRRRIIRWYRTLHDIDLKSETLSAAQIDDALQELRTVTEELNASPRPPLGRMNEFYDVHLHIDLVKRRLYERRERLAAAA